MAGTICAWAHPRFEVCLWFGSVLGKTMSFLCPKYSGGGCEGGVQACAGRAHGVQALK